LACLADEPVSKECHRVLESMCQRVAVAPLSPRLRWLKGLASLARGRSATEGLFFSQELARVIQRWAEDTQYDITLAFCSSMAPYLNVGRLRRVPCVVDLVDVDSQKWFDYAGQARRPASWLFRLEGRRVRKLEQQVAGHSQAVVVVSSAEADLLRVFCPDSPVHPISNGVDLDHFRPVDRQDAADSAATQLECVFVGALDYRANVDGATWFCREVWPQVHAQYPEAKFVLVGRRPDPQIRGLAKQPGVELVGEVADVLPYLQRARLVVVPLRIARGIQNKVLEAMAAGKAVIASPQALEGLNVVPGKQVCQADEPVEWFSAITKLLRDDRERRRLGAAARAFVCQHHRWDSCLRPLEVLLGLSEETPAPAIPPVLSPALK
jgi:polysaccharide biosynthesis protein PslH